MHGATPRAQPIGATAGSGAVGEKAAARRLVTTNIAEKRFTWKAEIA